MELERYNPSLPPSLPPSVDYQFTRCASFVNDPSSLPPCPASLPLSVDRHPPVANRLLMVMAYQMHGRGVHGGGVQLGDCRGVCSGGCLVRLGPGKPPLFILLVFLFFISMFFPIRLSGGRRWGGGGSSSLPPLFFVPFALLFPFFFLLLPCFLPVFYFVSSLFFVITLRVYGRHTNSHYGSFIT